MKQPFLVVLDHSDEADADELAQAMAVKVAGLGEVLAVVPVNRTETIPGGAVRG